MPDEGKRACGMMRSGYWLLGRRSDKIPSYMLDAFSAGDVPYTLELAERVSEARIHFIEEPLLPDDVDGYKQLCREVRGTRIASGEHEATRFAFQQLIRKRRCMFSSRTSRSPAA
jgi:L-alanine-DL-glutamate epimerase-like enolase superfamily enzyme